MIIQLKTLILNTSNTTAPYHLFGHWHDGEEFSIRSIQLFILDDMYNRKKKFKCVIIDIMTEKEAIAKVIKKGRKILLKCPQSNDIANHNKKIIDLLRKMMVI